MRTISLLLPVMLALLLIPAHASAQTSENSSLSAVAQAVLDDVNAARVQNGLPPLAVSPALSAAAQQHVDDVVANGNWGHYGSDGSNVQMRAARAGYPSSWVSENWVAVPSPERAISWWMNDWIHRVNILTPHWEEIGVGATQAGNGYWVLVTDFGNRDGSVPVLADIGDPTEFSSNANPNGVETIPPGGMDYTIRGGDTLLGIAIRYGLDWQDIAIVNDLGEGQLLQIDQIIWLPGRGAVGGLAGSTPQAAAGSGRHLVRPGETLWTIASRYKIEWQTLAALNDLGETDLLQIDVELVLPAGVGEETEAGATDEATDAGADIEFTAETAAGENSPRTTAAADRSELDAPLMATPASDHLRSASPTLQQARPLDRYQVQPGDTLSTIAEQYDLAWELLANANGLGEDDFLQIGQELAIPYQASAGSETGTAPISSVSSGHSLDTDAESLTYRVKRGDTLFGIALQYDVDLADILNANDLDEESILQLDQELIIP